MSSPGTELLSCLHGAARALACLAAAAAALNSVSWCCDLYCMRSLWQFLLARALSSVAPLAPAHWNPQRMSRWQRQSSSSSSSRVSSDMGSSNNSSSSRKERRRGKDDLAAA